MKTDDHLRANVIDELNWDPKLNGAKIGVSVKSGIVILTGRVDNYSIKLSAEDAVKRVKDVKGIVEEITVHLSNESKRSDLELAVAAVSALKWNYAIPDRKIEVIVENGWLTLVGYLDWQYQKDAAANVVKDIIGLKGFTNLITIKPIINSEVVRDTIKKALERSADIESDGIVIEINGNKVTLRGKTRSWNERNEIERAVWCAPGVMQVDDELVIS